MPTPGSRRALLGMLLGIGLFLSQTATHALVRTLAGIGALGCAAAIIVLSRRSPVPRPATSDERPVLFRLARSLWLGGGGLALLVAGELVGPSELQGPLRGFGLFLVAAVALSYFFGRGTGGTDLDI
ncbi:MAG TPA: hypothetical protein VFS55_01905 [Dokdonella sp.]|nr:hypothetical protein [Dokdonella sp.]